MNRALTHSTLALAALAAVGYALSGFAATPEKPAAPGEKATEHARRSVRMLDDVYKSTIVLITDKYVHDEDDYPAGSAAVELFKQISKKGWHDVQLLDATGAPYEAANVADDAFEKKAVAEIKAGKDYYEEIVQAKGGDWSLRAATPVPVVLERCIMCHPHYADAAKKGEAIGIISYTMPIQ